MTTQLPDDIKQALETIIAYLWDDECRHYLCSEPRQSTPHVFESLRKLKSWLRSDTEE